jgi:hypothetical protein
MYDVGLSRASGVPEMTQVVGLIHAHDGNWVVFDLMLQSKIDAPLLDRVVGDTDMAWPSVPIVPTAPT